MELERIYDRLTRHEGLRLKVYDDKTGEPLDVGDKLFGHPTIGIGRALDTNGISPEEARYLLRNDVDKVISQCRRRFYWFDNLNAVRQEVVINCCFNLGVGGFAGFQDTIAAIVRADWLEAGRNLLDSDAARELPGRYQELATAMRDGKWPESI